MITVVNIETLPNVFIVNINQRNCERKFINPCRVVWDHRETKETSADQGTW